MDKLPTDKELLLRISTRPNDTNALGDVFGGWLMSQMDIGGAIIAYRTSNGPVATVAVKEILFLNPILLRDRVSFYGELIRVGTSSMTISLEVYSERVGKNNTIEVTKVATGEFVYVAIESPGKKRIIKQKL